MCIAVLNIRCLLPRAHALTSRGKHMYPSTNGASNKKLEGSSGAQRLRDQQSDTGKPEDPEKAKQQPSVNRGRGLRPKVKRKGANVGWDPDYCSGDWCGPRRSTPANDDATTVVPETLSGDNITIKRGRLNHRYINTLQKKRPPTPKDKLEIVLANNIKNNNLGPRSPKNRIKSFFFS